MTQYTPDPFEQLLRHWHEEEDVIMKANRAIMAQEHITQEELGELLEGFCLAGAIEITSEAAGSKQDPVGRFDQIFVDQWNNGPAEDSFSGFIYVAIPHRKWLKIPFEC